VKVAPPRRHLATTEEKIQAELREMKKREEELKYASLHCSFFISFKDS